ncbi:helix-turn-helix domain-containing protein [Cognatiyoonia sp. IB215446]|uniref:AraC family transcriptional regulator n=1 Tax=Cognatiyoonia sp. IB215446 TaxID=3097355 RepID=UPI002A0B0632|nr:helix-turn-helix domain-containing protein [Cognatiyoonia sp. IB215446]MDX8350200.1 helix-turn-helix domain-containing protein [Cognatiyoonia sp. IB215446]
MDTEAVDFIRWTSRPTEIQQFTIMPDGCRDVILRQSTHGHVLRLTSLDHRPRTITLMPGDEITGYRLRPGLILDPVSLALDDLPEAIRHAQSRDRDLSGAINALGNEGTSVQLVAQTLGVSLRTLQRHLARRGLPPPEFWRLLGRARRAAIALKTNLPLTDIAGDFGYSDQAHMTRALRHWFGRSPLALRRDEALLNSIDQPALGTWRAA